MSLFTRFPAVRLTATRTMSANLATVPRTLAFSTTSVIRSGTDKSHANDPDTTSFVPKKIQEKLPEEIENAVPDAIHDTSANRSRSHATSKDDSVVPETVQEAAPEGVERALPEGLHPTKR